MRPAALERAQAAVDALHSRRESAYSALRAAIAAGSNVVGDESAHARRVRDLDAEIHEVDRDIQVATASRDAAMRPHAVAVADALAPVRRQAAREAVDASARLGRALTILDEVATEIGRVGGEALRFGQLYRSGVAALGERLARLAK